MRTREEITKGVKMKKPLSLVFVFIIVVFWDSAVFSLDVMGPPAANLEYMQTEAGIEFTTSEMDLELTNGEFTDYVDGVLDLWGTAFDIKLKDLKVNRTYAHIGYGASDNFELFLRLGGFGAKFGDSIWERSEKFESDAELGIGGGTKFTLYKEGGFKLGGLFQISNTSFDGKLTSPSLASSDFTEINMTEAQLAFGASCEFNEHLSLYGGPFLHFASGTIEDEYSEIDSDTGGLLTSKWKWDIEQDSVFGGYFGVQMKFTENCSFNLEYQHTADARAFGIGLLWKF